MADSGGRAGRTEQDDKSFEFIENRGMDDPSACRIKFIPCPADMVPARNLPCGQQRSYGSSALSNHNAGVGRTQPPSGSVMRADYC